MIVAVAEWPLLQTDKVCFAMQQKRLEKSRHKPGWLTGFFLTLKAQRSHNHDWGRSLEVAAGLSSVWPLVPSGDGGGGCTSPKQTSLTSNALCVSLVVPCVAVAAAVTHFGSGLGFVSFFKV